MKLRMYGIYATRSLARGGQRTLFAVFCVAVGVLAIVSLQLVADSVNAALMVNIRGLNGGDIAVHTEGADLTPLQLGVFDTLRAQGSITAYTAVTTDGGSSSGVTSSLAAYSVWAVDPATFPLAGAPHFLTPSGGSLPTVLAGGGAVVSQVLAQQLGAHVGGAITFTTYTGRTATVTLNGIIANAGNFAQPMLLISQAFYAALPSLAGAPVGYTWVFVDVPGHRDAAAASAAARIRQRLPLVATTTVPELVRQTQREVDNIRHFLQVIGLLALLIGGVGILNTMQVLLRRRQLEVAMLKTMGYRRRDLNVMFGLEAALLGLAGGVVGAVAGVGMSFLVRALFERAFWLDLPADIAPLTVGSGVAVGVCATLIFGLLPIVQAGQVRPLVVLRETRERAGWRGRATTGALGALVSALFFALAFGILRDALIAVAVVGGAALVLGLLTLSFGALAWGVSHLPVAPLPRVCQANARLALRNIGRQKARTATTLVALFGGVFAIGLGLALGQGLTTSLERFASTNIQYNAFVLASAKDKPTIDQQLAGAPGLAGELVTSATPTQLIAVNGVPVARATSGVGGGVGGNVPGLGANLSGVDGLDLAAGDMPPVRIARGLGDTALGRNLDVTDAGTTNVLVPLSYSQAPLDLRLRDILTVADLAGKIRVNLRITGFYSGGQLASFAPILADQRVVAALSGGAPLFYVYALHLDVATSGQVLGRIKSAAPTAVTISVAALLEEIKNLLASIVLLIESIASLAVLASLIMIANAVALAMLERRREMGILKAIGHTSRSVLGMVLVENAIVGLIGSLMAVLGVTLIALLINRLAFRFASGFGANPPLALTLMLTTVAICMAVAGGVAWRATRVRPLDVLRYE
ncbi:MAG: FtsX-like permease family protein [Ktedonobacterales bacterium]|nr:FtsX-like permease family protein [Ktedonobacterales bacterium]